MGNHDSYSDYLNYNDTDEMSGMRKSGRARSGEYLREIRRHFAGGGTWRTIPRHNLP